MPNWEAVKATQDLLKAKADAERQDLTDTYAKIGYFVGRNGHNESFTLSDGSTFTPTQTPLYAPPPPPPPAPAAPAPAWLTQPTPVAQPAPGPMANDNPSGAPELMQGGPMGGGQPMGTGQPQQGGQMDFMGFVNQYLQNNPSFINRLNQWNQSQQQGQSQGYQTPMAQSQPMDTQLARRNAIQPAMSMWPSVSNGGFYGQ